MSSAIPSVLLSQLQSIEAAEFSGRLPRITSSTGNAYYCKLGSAAEAEQYAGEVKSLNAIGRAAPDFAPTVLRSGTDDDGRPYFVSEYKDLGRLTDDAAVALAARVAEMHSYRSRDGFGFGVPTYCGATRLQNGWFESWEASYSSLIGDLLSQLRKTGRYNALCQKGEHIRDQTIPKLLGQSWQLATGATRILNQSGNIGVDVDGKGPVIFDPASYYGHNEADLAIGRIFGGIPKTFFSRYHEHLPKTEPAEEYELRGHLYELFHYLNHTLLFGVHYATNAEQKMDILLKEK